MAKIERKKLLSIIAIVTISVFTIVNGAMYIKTISEHKFIDQENKMVESAFNWYYTLYNESYKKAIESNQNIIEKTEQEIKSEYSNRQEDLEYDLLFISDGGNTLNQILEKSIKGVVLNDVSQDRADSNDPFWATKDYIISDLSVDCSSDGYLRNFENEAKLHDNTKLAKIALSKLNKQSIEQPIFWQFELSRYDIKIQDMSFDNMKTLLKNYKCNLDIFHNVEFLVPTYVYYDKDLLGNKLIKDGTKNENVKQLILVQGFNVNDYINSNPVYMSIKDSYKSEMEKLYKDYKLYNTISNIIILLCIIIEGVLIVLSAIIYNKNCENCDKI